MKAAVCILRVLAVLVWALGGVPPLFCAPPPNILLLVADDLGWNDVGYHGGRVLTPHLDRLAKEGVELDQHYVHPVCTPTRAALLTGRYPSRFGPHALHPSNRRALPAGTETIASALRSKGYRTAMAGKWHLGSRPEWGPNHYGFEESYGILTGAGDPWTHQYRPGPYAKTWHRNLRPLEEEGNMTELLARQVADWITHLPRPWFIYVPFTAVHIPIDAPPEYQARYEGRRFFEDPTQDDSARRYAAYVTQMDSKIGAFLGALDAAGAREQTLVVFTSDNGGLPGGLNPYIGKVRPAPVAGDNAPLRGFKAQLYEGGIRVPALAYWKGRLLPRKVTAPLHAVDWMPTLTRLAGYRPAKDLSWDGRDIWPLLTGEVTRSEPRTLYWAYDRQSALRHGDWKLISRATGKQELFDLATDPMENVDRAGREPERLLHLQTLLQQARHGDRGAIPEDLRESPP